MIKIRKKKNKKKIKNNKRKRCLMKYKTNLLKLY